jgi:uncharacterized membrane protein
MSQGGRRASIDLSTERLEAFSDAVIAVIMTILALELKPPEHLTSQAIFSAIGFLLIYVLAFVNLAIWWNNHHHLLRATERISGAVMWANMSLLFFLSLIPVATEWIKMDWAIQFEPNVPLVALPAAFFGIVSLCAAVAYSILVRTIIAANGPTSLVARSVHGDRKGWTSLILYGAGVLAAIVTQNVWISYALYVAVAIMWLIPDRRFLHEHVEDGSHPSS